MSQHRKERTPPSLCTISVDHNTCQVAAAEKRRWIRNCKYKKRRHCRLHSRFAPMMARPESPAFSNSSCLGLRRQGWSMTSRLRLRYRVDQGTPRTPPFVHTQVPTTVDKRLGAEIDDGHQKIEPIWTGGNGHRIYRGFKQCVFTKSKLIFTFSWECTPAFKM